MGMWFVVGLLAAIALWVLWVLISGVLQACGVKGTMLDAPPSGGFD